MQMKKVLVYGVSLLVVIVIALYLTMYTIAVYRVVGYIGEYPELGGVYWSYSPSGSLFPWPREPGMLTALSPASSIDAFLYKYVIKTNMLILAIAVTYLLAAYLAYRLIRAVK